MKATYETGVQGELIAEKFLTSLGMVCLERRHREKAGEIDLIMEDGETLVFVEVKTRLSGKRSGQGLEAVNLAKQKRIAKCATLYLMKHGWLRRQIRFDVIEINAMEILHIPNAFQPGGMFF